MLDQRLRDLIDRFSSPEPTPGGGSAAALAGAVGASLLLMVASLPKTRRNTPDERQILSAAAASLRRTRDELAAAVQQDTDAYDRVLAAYRLSKTSDEERAVRTRAIQEALGGAADVPLRVMALAVTALQQAVSVAGVASAAARSDVGVALALLDAALHGAALNVEANLGAMTDRTDADRRSAEAARARDSAGRYTTAARAALDANPA